jgi:hypothetical protein
MSFNVRDSRGVFGPFAAVEFPNGAGQSVLAGLQAYEPVTYNAPTAAQFVAATTYTIYLSPPNPSAATALLPLGVTNRVVGASMYYSTAATGAATFSAEICAPGVANGSGTAVITNAALNTAASNTPTNVTLNSNIDNLTFSPNSRLNLIVGATATTALVDFVVVFYIIRAD